jgi:chitodextrinase
MNHGRIAGALLASAGMLGGALALAAPSSATTLDTQPPTAPGNLRQVGVHGGDPVLGWDVSTDNSGTIKRYKVLRDGQLIQYVSSGTTIALDEMVTLCHIVPGFSYTFTIKAIDPSGNVSVASNALTVFVA